MVWCKKCGDGANIQSNNTTLHVGRMHAYNYEIVCRSKCITWCRFSFNETAFLPSPSVFDSCSTICFNCGHKNWDAAKTPIHIPKNTNDSRPHHPSANESAKWRKYDGRKKRKPKRNWLNQLTTSAMSLKQLLCVHDDVRGGAGGDATCTRD